MRVNAWLKCHLLIEMECWVEPRCYKLVPLVGTGFILYKCLRRDISCLINKSIFNFQTEVIKRIKRVLASDVAKSISQSLYKEAVVCRMNDRLVDLTHPLQEDCELTFYTLKDQEGLNVMRHSARLSTSTYSIISRCKINNRSCH